MRPSWKLQGIIETVGLLPFDEVERLFRNHSNRNDTAHD